MTDSAHDRSLLLDPAPDDTLSALHTTQPRVADAIENALDWIEADPPAPKSKRRRFTNGMWAITVLAAGQEWLVIWEEPTFNRPYVRHWRGNVVVTQPPTSSTEIGGTSCNAREPAGTPARCTGKRAIAARFRATAGSVRI